ncbi:MAG: LPS-assembly protein LptD [Opitutaceae bacterium]|nr:LPS-assembly protein LptD [Opitutaceae bacterium]
MKLRSSILLSVLVLGACMRTLAAGEALDLTSSTNKPIEFDYNSKEMIVADARLVYGDLTLTADEIRYNDQTGQANARGNLVLTRGDVRLVADEGTYTLADGKVRLKNTRAGYYPLYLQGRSLEGNMKEFTLTDATLTYGEPGFLTPTVRASSIDFVQGKNFKAHHAALRLGSIPLLPLPVFNQRLDAPPLETEIRAGLRSSIGTFLTVTTLAPVSAGVRIGPNIGLFSKRGVLIGPAARYDTQRGETTFTGELRSGWIHDFAGSNRRGLDSLDQRIGQERGLIDWRHLQTTGEHLSVMAQLAYWSDSEVVRDFDRSRFPRNQQPETFVEATYAGDNTLGSVFVRAQPNDFQITQRREPELSVQLLTSPQDLGFIHRGNVGFVSLHENAATFAPTLSNLSSKRFDAYYGVERPTVLAPWLTLTPVAGARLTHYLSPLGGKDDYSRVLGQFGGDLRGHAYGQFEVKSERWHIDGLRHLLEPFVQYRYIPDAEKGRAYIPRIDRSVFSTRLQPIDLGEIRFLDDLNEINTLRYGLEQRLQTRDPKGGSRDLIALTLAQDLRFARRLGEHRSSDLHADLALMPARWLRLDFFQRLNLQNPRLEEFNSGITFTDGEFWSARFGTQFLRDQLEEYTLDGQIRLNERYALTGRWRFDAIDNSLYEQVYGLRQTIRNLWSIEYQIAFLEGQRHENGFQFRVSLEVFKF